jgi:Universal stress protein family
VVTAAFLSDGWNDRMKRVLIPSDFGPQSRHAIRYATQKFSRDLERVVLLNAIFAPTVKKSTLVHLEDILSERATRGLMAEKQFILGLIPNIDVKTISKPIPIIEAIHEVLREEDIDLVLMPPLSTQHGFQVNSGDIQLTQSFKIPVLIVPFQP